MKYPIWTARALLAWTPVVSLLLAAGAFGMAHPAAAWHQRLVGLLVVAGTVMIVGARHRLHQRIRASISHTLECGAWVVNRTATPLRDREVERLETGLAEARERVQDAFPRRNVSHAGAFVVVQEIVLNHQDRANGKPVRVGGLTYPAGGMVLERKADVYALEDLACHEGVHALLYRLGVQAPTGHEHHNQYPELFRPVGT